MRIAGVGGAFPGHYYSQQQVATALKRHWSERLENPEILDRLFARVGVKDSHLRSLFYDGFSDGMLDRHSAMAAASSSASSLTPLAGRISMTSGVP